MMESVLSMTTDSINTPIKYDIKNIKVEKCDPERNKRHMDDGLRSWLKNLNAAIEYTEVVTGVIWPDKVKKTVLSQWLTG